MNSQQMGVFKKTNWARNVGHEMSLETLHAHLLQLVET